MGRQFELMFRALSGGNGWHPFLPIERPDALQPSAFYIQDRDEVRIVRFADLPCGGGDGLGEARRRVFGRQGRLEHQQFVKCCVFADDFRLFGDEVRQRHVAQPHAAEGVSFAEDDHRIQARLLQAGREKQRCIQAGRDPAIENRGRGADFLSLGLEAGRRQCITQVELRDGRPDRRGEQPDLFGRAPIAVDLVRLAFLAQGV